MPEQEIFTLFNSLLGAMCVYCLLLVLSQVSLSISVYTSAKARDVANPLLYTAITFFCGVIGAIIYACTKNKLTRADEVKRSSSVFWLVLSIVLAIGGFMVFMTMMVNYIMNFAMLTDAGYYANY